MRNITTLTASGAVQPGTSAGTFLLLLFAACDDQTQWLLSYAPFPELPEWQQLPVLPQPGAGVRNVKTLCTSPDTQGTALLVFAGCDDQTQWMLSYMPFPAVLAWTQIPTLPVI